MTVERPPPLGNRSRITAWSNLASTCRAGGCPHRQAVGAGTKASMTPPGDSYAALPPEAVGRGAKKPLSGLPWQGGIPRRLPRLPVPPLAPINHELLTWSLRDWPGVVTRVQQLSHSKTRMQRKKQENNTHRGSPERLSQGQAPLSCLNLKQASNSSTQPSLAHWYPPGHATEEVILLLVLRLHLGLAGLHPGLSPPQFVQGA